MAQTITLCDWCDRPAWRALIERDGWRNLACVRHFFAYAFDYAHLPGIARVEAVQS